MVFTSCASFKDFVFKFKLQKLYISLLKTERKLNRLELILLEYFTTLFVVVKVGFGRIHGLRSAECGVRSAECGVRSAECGVRSAECGVRSAECGVRSAECGVRSAECGVRSAECGVRSAKCGVRSAECGVRSAECMSMGTVIGLLFTTLAYIKIYLAVRRHKNQNRVQQVQNAENFASLIKSAFGTFYVFLVFLACYLPIFICLTAIAIYDPNIALKRLLL